MIKSKLIWLFAFLAFASFLFLFEACNQFISEIPVKETAPKITTLKLKFTNTESGQISEFVYRDIENYGVQETFQADTIFLAHGKEYTASLEFLDESKPRNPINHTNDIRNDAKNYLVCLDASTIGIVLRTDNDGQFPLGLETKWLNGASAKGKFTLDLKHQPNIKNGTCGLGTSLINLELPIIVK
jgi:hypothetical protein